MTVIPDGSSSSTTFLAFGETERPAGRFGSGARWRRLTLAAKQKMGGAGELACGDEEVRSESCGKKCKDEEREEGTGRHIQ